MLLTRFRRSIAAVCVSLGLGGCTLRPPDHVTVTGRHGEAQTVGGPHQLDTTTNEVSASITYDLH